MVKGYMEGGGFPFTVWPTDDQLEDFTSIVIFPADQLQEVKELLENIRIMARNDPAELAGEIIKDSEAALKILEGGE